MKLIPLTNRQAQILKLLRTSSPLSANSIQNTHPETVSIATVKRDIAVLTQGGFIASSGAGRSAGYELTPLGKLFTPVDAHLYCMEDPDKRNGFKHYDAQLISSIPSTVFSSEELSLLAQETKHFHERSRELSDTVARKELERFIIELSWKSSRIEGNTYTLLDTERLIRDGIQAAGHTRDEGIMILNHKRAFEFILANIKEFQGIPAKAAIEEIHRLLTYDLRVQPGMRRNIVGIIGTSYLPLDNRYQIEEAVEALRRTIGNATDPYTAALIALLGISYIQPFEDGNKRTARLLANAVLLARGVAPLSYRNADEALYREATLVFYETHSLFPFKRIFTEQYLFSAHHYGLREVI